MTPLPPGSKAPALVQSFRYWTAPRHTLHTWRRRYGDVFMATVYPLGKVVFLCDVEDIRQLLKTDPDIVPTGVANAALGSLPSEYSVLSIDGERHMRARRLLMPAFHGRAVQRQIDSIAELAVENMTKWPTGRPFKIHPHMRELALQIILRVVMGIDNHRMHAVRDALIRLCTDESVLELALGGASAKVLPYAKRREQHLVEAHELLQQQIETHRNGGDLAERTDVLAMLLAARDDNGEPMCDREIRDQLITLLLAGHETTAAGLSWAFERLTRNPDVLVKACAAADDDDQDYLEALVKETLRTRSVVPDLSRMAAEEIEVGGFRVEKGTILVPCIDMVHESPHLFPEPDRFRPERFLGDRSVQVNWLPFGGGVRRCIGATFSLVEMRVVLREILRRVEFVPTSEPDEPRRRTHVTVEPAKGAVVTVYARNTASGSVDNTVLAG